MQTMQLSAMTIDPRLLWQGEPPWAGPLLFIDLESSEDTPETVLLPPCPTIGLGDTSHPLAGKLDGIIEPPMTAEGLARQVLKNPHAAAVTVQLLRVLPLLPMAEGLTVESLAYGLLQGSREHQTWLADRMPSSRPQRSAGKILVSREGDRLIATLDHPDSGNAIDHHMRDQLHEALTLAALDPDVRQVSIRATGRTFSLGAELGEFGTTIDPATAHSIRSYTLPARAAARCSKKLEVHVQGGCVGSGLELAAFAQRITATRDAWFHLPELSMGILPGAGGCVSLTRRVGRQRAAQMILSGKRLNARQALVWGLVDALVDEPPANERGADIV